MIVTLVLKNGVSIPVRCLSLDIDYYPTGTIKSLNWNVGDNLRKMIYTGPDVIAAIYQDDDVTVNCDVI